MTISINITKRERRRKLKSGETVLHTRYVLNYRDPRTGKRVQLFFDRQKDALARRAEILVAVETGTHTPVRKAITVAEAVAHWLEGREGEVKARTLKGYRQAAGYITEPLLIGTPKQRAEYAVTGRKPPGARLVPMLGATKLTELSTADIRAWHRTLVHEVGSYTANRAKLFLGTVLRLAAEDWGIRPAPMPTGLGRGRTRQKKAILTPDQVAVLLRAARQDRDRGIYYAFPFLAGTRPSEMLGLLWSDVNFEANVIRIRRMQEMDGTLAEMTKTEAGTREIPMCRMLREMLLEWRMSCPRSGGRLHRVFPGPGRLQPWPQPRKGGGGPLLYGNFRNRFWAPALKRLGLPYVSPHSARHCFISTLQAQGIEVGLVAKLAGHANAVVTLGHYTQAVRGAEHAIQALEAAFGG